MVAQWARATGASRVLVFDIVAEKLALARELGFTSVHDSRETDPVAAVLDATDGRGAHLAIEAAGVPATTIQALGAVRVGGRVVFLGNPSAAVALPAELLSSILRREIDVRGTWNSTYSAAGGDDDWRASLDAVATGRLRLEPLVTHRWSLEEALDGLRKMHRAEGFFAKALVEPGR